MGNGMLAEVYLYCIDGLYCTVLYLCATGIVFVFPNKAIMSDVGMRVEGLNWLDRMLCSKLLRSQ